MTVNAPMIEMSEFTQTQKDIIDYASNHQNATGREISNEVGCSASYANQIKKEYLDAIVGENNLTEIARTITLAHPYEILGSPEILSQLGLESGGVAEIEIKCGDTTLTKRAPVREISELDDARELHSFTYAVSNLAPDVPSNVKEFVGEYIDADDDDDISIYTSDGFEDYTNRIIDMVDKRSEKSDIHIGIGIFEEVYHITRGTQSASESISVPRYETTRGRLKDLLSEERPEVLDIRNYDGDLMEVDKLYFTTPPGFGEKDIEKSTNWIKEQRYFDPSIRYDLDPVDGVSGIETLEPANEVIDASDSDIVYGELNFDGFTLPQSVGESEIFDILEDIEVTFEIDDEEFEAQVSISEGLALLNFGGLTIPITVGEDMLMVIYREYTNSIRELCENLLQFISNEIDDSVEFGRIDLDLNTRTNPKNWIFDTNAIYHQIVDDKSSNILRSILPNLQIYDKELIIPWPVVYEINKHKDDSDSGPPPAVQEKGIDNLETLQILYEYEFIDLKVESPPSPIRTAVSESHIADLHIMKKAESEEGSVLISGDRRLRKLAGISGAEVIDIRELAVVNDTPDLGSEVLEQVHGKIGSEIDTREEIIDQIEENKKETINETVYKHPNTAEADDYLEEWVKDGEIITYIPKDKNEIKYEKCVDVDLVVTPSVASKLTQHIKDYDGEKYLTGEILESLSSTLNLPTPGYPLITFHVPLTNVLGPQTTTMGGISTEARHFYKIKQVQNAKYEVAEVNQEETIGEKVQDAVQLAKNNQYSILCTEADRYIEPIGGLLGLDVRECDF